jgi:acetyl esterase/lipase
MSTGLALIPLFFTDAITALSAASAPGVELVADVAYLGEGRAEKLDIYQPAARGTAPLRPAVVYFHGGGWVRGDKADPREQNIGANLAAVGYVFVTVNYVLGAHAWPQNLQDCKNAVRFIRQNAAKYGVDPERIVAMGTSAGGHLALMAAYSDRPEFEPAAPYPGVSSRVCAVVDFYGMTNLLTRQQAAEDGTPTGKLYDSHAPEVIGVSRAEGAAVWKLASPVTYVAPGSPPTLIMHGLSDPTVNYGQAVELANALRAKGVAHELVLLEGVGHMFDLESWDKKPLPFDIRPTLLAFLEKYTRAAAANSARSKN